MTAALSIRDLQKTYDNGFRALKGVSFDVQPGDFFALLGPNGAGKSTTIGILCSLVRKTGGCVSIFGIDIDRDFPRAKQMLGVVPQEFNFSQFEKVFDIVCTQGGFYGMPRALAEERTEKYLRKLGLWDKRSTQARMLSGGMKRRLMIARALIHEPKLLILDEPTAGVDIELRRSMWEFLQEINAQGTTIILTTHYLEEAESLCRNIAIIDKGDIIENTSIKSLIKTLSKEVFILDTREALGEAPDFGSFEGRLLDEHSLEVTVEKGQSLSDLFAHLSAQKLSVTSMRNRANRLEELFVSLLAQNKQQDVENQEVKS
ncbi:ABC transporter ATP-binding protein [Microbulbifer bruguierae]|uniref:ABC transporter ATP-binding protein n=1 Tax=Microbulbifer bruguierae TaxID=3029061 RepID=A0ABY8NEV5_9GAMM|nr:ABC transporter ATP-binding protein [Microbulbifer bruguierae]WGL17459.1 ABC transporter ATP-binding protein [Microbulbifer bruguierae]